MIIVERSVAAYRERFGSVPEFGATAPGRVELMGNHTDYNGGYVLPAALDRATAVVGSPSTDGKITLFALDLNETAEFGTIGLTRTGTWADYVLGVVDQLQKAGVDAGGFSAVIHSDVPTGAGLSSSAALEVATAYFLRQLHPYDLSPNPSPPERGVKDLSPNPSPPERGVTDYAPSMDVARLCQRAENGFVGVNSGILDQFSSIFGRKDSLLFLDCLTLEHDTVKMGRDDIAIVICDSRVKHALTGGDYNTRRAECMAAAQHFGKKLLREVDWDEFVAREGELPIEQRKRARHVLTEDRRVLAMREAVAKADVDAIGRLLSEAHASCRDLFENSTEEIDFLAATAARIDGCIGSKLTGGGWGGCTVNLVYESAVDGFCRELAVRYKEKFAVEASIYPCKASEGARAVEV